MFANFCVCASFRFRWDPIQLRKILKLDPDPPWRCVVCGCVAASVAELVQNLHPLQSKYVLSTP